MDQPEDGQPERNPNSKWAGRASFTDHRASFSGLDDGNDLLQGLTSEDDIPTDQKLLSTSSVFLITMNVIVGSGALGLPAAFRQGGFLLSVALMAGSTILNTLSMGLLLESMARAEAIHTGCKIPQIRVEKFEYVRLADILLGRAGRCFTEIAFALYMYGLLWSYCTMFGLSLSDVTNHFGLCQESGDGVCEGSLISSSPSPSYLISVGIFAVLAIPAACMDLKDQECVQTMLSLYRFAAFGIMILTTAIVMGSDPSNTSIPPTASSVKDISALFATIGTSQIMHFCFPTVAEGARDKKALFSIFSMAFLASFILFSALGGIAACYCYEVGSDKCVNKLITNDWGKYTGHDFSGSVEHLDGVEWWAFIIRYFILVFPAIAMLSNYPLAALSFGNNIHSMMSESMIARLGSKDMLVAKLIAATPPMILALLVSDLTVVFEVVGGIAYILGFILPGVFYLASLKAAAEHGSHLTTPYTFWWSTPLLAKFMIGFGVSCIIFTIASLFFPSRRSYK